MFTQSLQHFSYGSENDSIDLLDNLYNSNLLNVIEAQAPLCSRIITSCPFSQWYTDDMREIKREVRGLERRYIKTRIIYDHVKFREKWIDSFNEGLERPMLGFVT